MTLLLNCIAALSVLAMTAIWVHTCELNGLLCLAVMLGFGAFLAHPFQETEESNSEMEKFALWGISIFCLLSSFLILLQYHKESMILALCAGIFISIKGGGIIRSIIKLCENKSAAEQQLQGSGLARSAEQANNEISARQFSSQA